MDTVITAAQWAQYDRDGYLKLGKVVGDDTLRKLQLRIDDIMTGRADVQYTKMMMQEDSTTGKYEDIGPQTFGHKGASLRYRKIQNLDLDPVFMNYIRQPVFDRACRRVYGERQAISSFRTMFFNKPAAAAGSSGGTPLGWHQDRWVHLSVDPELTVWTALDRADRSTGCVEVIPGSHRKGLINPEHPSGFLTAEQAAVHCRDCDVVRLEMDAGEVALLHNWTIHRSGVNTSRAASRRALSVNYMLASTQVRDVGGRCVGSSTGHAEGSDRFPVIFDRSGSKL
eukprot:TRINITY_DN3030_c3_g1_i1.p1 TRINITY_DN3030_c3_g1~~TRINITY_DN3030_c3_g1_i1.p1  ORF type:complete len:313 (+),score=86.71 TRINITY_DN3030_c3_g1_i1:92-940(+)